MKKILAILLTVLCVLTLAACASSQPQPATEAETSAKGEEPLDGGWTLSESDAATLPEEVQTAFDKATDSLTGGYYVPVGYLGSQVVAGMNYALLCELFPSTKTSDTAPEGKFEVIIIYNDLNGNAEITHAAGFNVADYTSDGGKTKSEVLAGGWSAPEKAYKATIPEDAQAAFDQAMQTYEGNALEATALLGTQVVSGVNYAFLCHSTAGAGDDAQSVIQIVTVYRDLDGNAQITNICTLDAADFNK